MNFKFLHLLRLNLYVPLLSFNFYKKELYIKVKLSNLTKVVYFLYYHFLYKYKLLTFCTGIDISNIKNQFILVYSLLSIPFNNRLNLYVNCKIFDRIHSLTFFYKNADWLEREIYDMFGIYFLYHKDLRRLLTDYSFEGFPLRKNFPLTGFKEVFYDSFLNKLRYKYVELPSQLRVNNYQMVWNDNYYIN